MWIQLLLLAGIAVVTMLLTRSTAGARHQAIRRLLLAGFVIVAVVAVLFPNWLTAVARVLGVGRGADLLLYATVIAFLSTIATTYRRLSDLDRKITVLARKLALAEARLPAGDEQASDEIGELRSSESLRSQSLAVEALGAEKDVPRGS